MSSRSDGEPGTQRRFGAALKWAFLMNSGVRFVGLLSTFVLAGILGPSDFGLATLAMVYITLVQVFLEGGISTALIQRERLERAHLDSAFWMMLVWCLVLAGLSLLTSGVWASVNGEPELKPIIQVLSIWLVLMGLAVVQQALLRREMRFKALALRTNVAVLVGSVTGIVLAVTGAGVWSLVVQEIVTSFVGLVLLWAVSGWRPSLRFSKRCARELLGFSVQALVGDLGAFIGRRADFLLIGVFLGPTVVGLYRLADRLVDGVLSVTTTPVGVVSLSHFSRLQSDTAKLSRAVISSVRATAFMNIPALFALAACASYLTGMLGSDWVPATPALRILALVGIAKALYIIVNPLLFALGRLRLRLLVIWSLAALSVGTFTVTGLVLSGYSIDAQVMWTAVTRGFLFALVFIPVSLLVLSVAGRVSVVSLLRVFVAPTTAAALGAGLVAAVGAIGAFDGLPSIVALVLAVLLAAASMLLALVVIDRQFRARLLALRPGRAPARAPAEPPPPADAPRVRKRFVRAGVGNRSQLH